MSTSHTLPPLPEPDWYAVDTVGADDEVTFVERMEDALELSGDGIPDTSKITSLYAGSKVRDYAHTALASTAAVQAALSSQAPAEIERKVYKDSVEHREYLSARFDHKHRTGISFEWDGHRWAYRYTSFDDAGEYDLLWRPDDTLQSRQPAEQEPYTTIDMGHGKWEVGAGKNAGLPCIAFGRNGTGKVGEPITTEPRQMSVEETFAVITFANVDGLDVLQDKMDQVREEFFPGTVCQFSQPAAPVAPVAVVPEGWDVTMRSDDEAITISPPTGSAWRFYADAEPQSKLHVAYRLMRAMLAASPTPPVQPAGFTLDEISDACIAAEVPDSKFEALSIALTTAQAEWGRK